MSCYPLVQDGKVVGSITVPDGETRPVPRRRRKNWWCFKCRKRLLHTRMGFYPQEPSWYGPNFWWECPKCHEENVLFPGREWVYEDE